MKRKKRHVRIAKWRMSLSEARGLVMHKYAWVRDAGHRAGYWHFLVEVSL